MSQLALPLLAVGALFAAMAPCQQEPSATPITHGHSGHGSAYDSGPRQRPWLMDGIGQTHFKVTTDHAEVQQWYDQGNTLLHSFWYFEAERAFRWCIKLDPTCAMAYLGVLRCRAHRPQDAAVFLEQAVANKDRVSEREQRIIEAWQKSFQPSLDRAPLPGMLAFIAGNKQLKDELERLVIDYPDDHEIKLLYLHHGRPKDKLGTDAMLRQVLAIEPDHPGAHHLRIHNFDTLEYGHAALDSCKVYGPIAKNIGHANHMPGHIYTKLGMWHEGAISLDAATRVEKRYMQRQLVFPYNAWNYAHNRNFLAFAQSMLGMPSLALQGARDMLNAPLDPKQNKTTTDFSVFGQGIAAMRRTLVRFERWQDILTPDLIPWPDTDYGRLWQQYCEARAHLGQGDVAAAEQLFQKLRAPADPSKLLPPRAVAMLSANKPKAGPPVGSPEDEAFPGANAMLAERTKAFRTIMEKELEARIRLYKGESLAAVTLMTEAAELEMEHRKEHNDPPPYPRCLYVVLGEMHLDLGSPALALAAFTKSTEVLRNNGFALSGMARAHHALDDLEAARSAYGRMLHVWSHAEPGIWQNETARALDLEVEPHDTSPAQQRNYRTETLDRLGPRLWQPYAAPVLDAVDASGRKVTLEQFRGKNVLLVYYLSEQCVHCVEQLREIEKRAAEFEQRNTVLLAISSDSPEKNAKSDLSQLPFRLLSDDEGHSNAIRWLSYDEFEDLELHSTNFIDSEGRLRWAQTGGDPFMDMDFLLNEIDRIAKIEKDGRLQPTLSKAAAANVRR